MALVASVVRSDVSHSSLGRTEGFSQAYRAQPVSLWGERKSEIVTGFLKQPSRASVDARLLTAKAEPADAGSLLGDGAVNSSSSEMISCSWLASALAFALAAPSADRGCASDCIDGGTGL